MSLFWTFIIGLLVGTVAKLIMPGRDPGGFLMTALLGIAGSLIARYLGEVVGWYRQGDPAGFIASVGGALILLALYRLIFGRRATS